MLHRKLSLSQ